MANFFGSPVARSVTTTSVYCLTGSWVQLNASGGPLTGRQWVKIQAKGIGNTMRLAIQYVNRNANGTFTAPTDTAHGHFIYPSVAMFEEPISDDVAIYGRAVANGGSAGGVRTVVAEYA